MDLTDYNKSGIIHKIMRNEIYKIVKPGVLLFDIRKQIEKLINRFSQYNENSYNYNTSSIAFPVGLSLNNCAAHFSPFSYDKIKYTESDILKIDYGVQFNGHMVDAAFSITHNPELEILKKISEEETIKVKKM
jgi:methionyl aminopeptidase